MQIVTLALIDTAVVGGRCDFSLTLCSLCFPCCWQGFVLAVTVIREAAEELRCYMRDKEVNSQIYSKLTARGQPQAGNAALLTARARVQAWEGLWAPGHVALWPRSPGTRGLLCWRLGFAEGSWHGLGGKGP